MKPEEENAILGAASREPGCSSREVSYWLNNIPCIQWRV
jgi:hypothetical protein